MSAVWVVPGALVDEPDWPEAEHALSAGGPEALLAQLRAAPLHRQQFESPWCNGAAHLSWLAAAFGIEGDPPPTAPYAWQNACRAESAPVGRPGAAQVWFCDPVHLVLQPERILLSPIERPPLSTGELERLHADADAAAREVGARIDVLGARWYFHSPQELDLKVCPLQAVLGASVQAHLPRAALWRRLLNDIQMRWHANEINRARQARGELTANGLWLHGGGGFKRLAPSPFSKVESDDPVLLGWQQATGDAGTPNERKDSLFQWPYLFDAYWRKDWPAWTRAWADLQGELTRQHRLASARDAGRGIELVACGRHSVNRFSLARAWSPRSWWPRGLRECLLEPGRARIT